MNDVDQVALLRSLKHTAAVFLALLYLDRPTSEAEISDLLQIHQQTARTHLHSLAKSGLITRTHRYAGWILTHGGRQLVLPASANISPSNVEISPTNANISPSPLKLRESDSKLNLNNSLTDSLTDSTNSNLEETNLLRNLRAAGVYLKTAQSLIARHPVETILLHLEHYRYALHKNLAQGPGWLVLSLNESWPAPLGYKSGNAPDRHRYADWGETGDEETRRRSC